MKLVSFDMIPYKHKGILKSSRPDQEKDDWEPWNLRSVLHI